MRTSQWRHRPFWHVNSGFHRKRQSQAPAMVFTACRSEALMYKPLQGIHAVFMEIPSWPLHTPHPDNSLMFNPWATSFAKHATSPCSKPHELEVMRLVMPAGKTMPSHWVKGEITVHCLEGEVDLTAHGQTQRMKAGQLVWLRRRCGSRPDGGAGLVAAADHRAAKITSQKRLQAQQARSQAATYSIAVKFRFRLTLHQHGHGLGRA